MLSLVSWIILAVILAIFEMFTTTCLVIWFALGALITGISLAIFPDMNFAVQLAIFLVSSIILFLITGRKLKNKLDKNGSQPVYSILGKTAIVTKEIDTIKGTGQININGDIWSAKTKESDTIIPEGSKVEILEVDGVRAVVKLLEQSNIK